MTPFEIESIDQRRLFAEEIAESLRRSPPQISSKYFYDALGSALFDAICQLPWYRITRAESALLERHAAEILAALAAPLTVAELGCGNGEKLAVLAGAADAPFQSIQLVDVSPAALDAARQRLEAMEAGTVVLHPATYEEGLARLARTPRDGEMLVLFLGSNIGNFEPGPARELLTRIRRVLRDGDALLLGTDLIKPERDLLLAYDDPLQVTAAFNRNLLRRINEELGGTFDLAQWAHRAVWNARCGRVEMHLVSRSRQDVRVAAADLAVRFEAGDSIWTESSYKYDPQAVLEMGRAAGFGRGQQWMDEAARFALTHFRV